MVGAFQAETGACAVTGVLAGLESRLSVAKHLTAVDAGAIEALRALARKIDAWDMIVRWALDDAEDEDRRPAVPQNDNVSISAFLKGCEQLGLTPTGRKALDVKGEVAKRGSLGDLQAAAAIRRKRSA